MDRRAALELLNAAKAPMRLLAPQTPPYLLTVSFTATGAEKSGEGELTELWLGPHNWRWTARLADFSMARVGTQSGSFDEKPVGIVPMRVHMLRNAIFWAAQGLTAASQFRSASVEWQGRAATCLLVSDRQDGGDTTQARRWDESEYCIDDATKLLQTLSIAPGSYTVYSYAGASYHGRPMPDRIRTFINGTAVIDASFRIDEPNVPPGTVQKATPEMMAAGSPPTLDEPMHLRLELPRASATETSMPVMVHAQPDADGKVLEAEICASADPVFASAALQWVKGFQSGRSNLQSQVYFDILFAPAVGDAFGDGRARIDSEREDRAVLSGADE